MLLAHVPQNIGIFLQLFDHRADAFFLPSICINLDKYRLEHAFFKTGAVFLVNAVAVGNLPAFLLSEQHGSQEPFLHLIPSLLNLQFQLVPVMIMLLSA